MAYHKLSAVLLSAILSNSSSMTSAAVSGSDPCPSTRQEAMKMLDGTTPVSTKSKGWGGFHENKYEARQFRLFGTVPQEVYVLFDGSKIGSMTSLYAGRDVSRFEVAFRGKFQGGSVSCGSSCDGKLLKWGLTVGPQTPLKDRLVEARLWAPSGERHVELNCIYSDGKDGR